MIASPNAIGSRSLPAWDPTGRAVGRPPRRVPLQNTPDTDHSRFTLSRTASYTSGMKGIDRPRQFAMESAVLLALYLALCGQATISEVAAGAVTAALAAGLLQLIRRCSGHRFEPRWGWYVLFLKRVWLRSLTDCAILLVPLWRRALHRDPIQGEMLEVPFAPGGADPRSAARRALVLAGVTVAPNTLAIRIDSRRSLLQVHRLVPQPHPPGGGDREWPI